MTTDRTNPKTAEAGRRIRAAAKSTHRGAGWGRQIRSYILAPYRIVRSERSDLTHSDPDTVLDGDIDDFLKEGLTRGR